MDWKFHPRCHGNNIHLKAPGWRASRKTDTYDNCFLFSDAPIPTGQTVSLLFKYEERGRAFEGGPRIGFTNQNPDHLDPASLASAHDPLEALNDKAWVTPVVLEQPSKGSLFMDYTVDELGCVLVQQAGQQKVISTMGAVDFKRPTWAVIDLFGFYNSILIQSSCPYVPPEIKSLGAEKNQLFLKALEGGSVNEPSVRVMIVGQFIRDTTALLHSLADNSRTESFCTYVFDDETHSKPPNVYWILQDTSAVPEEGTTQPHMEYVACHDWYKPTSQIHMPLAEICLLVFDLSSDLDKPATGENEPTLWETIDHQMRTIYAALENSGKQSRFIIVSTSTNTDEAAGSVIKGRFDELVDRLVDGPYKSGIWFRLLLGDGSKIIDVKATIKEAVSSLRSTDQEIPQKWLDWKAEVQKCPGVFDTIAGIKQKTGSITASMSDDEYWLMLEYYHKAGHILCLDWITKCPKTLTIDSTVITKPLTFITSIDLLASGIWRYSSDVFSVDIPDSILGHPDFLQIRGRLRDKGILDERLLTCLMIPESDFKKPLIDFMSKVDLLFEHRRANQSTSGGGHMGTSQGQGTSQRTFFMPCAIQGQGLVSYFSRNLEQSTVFYICFGSLLTDAFFSRLVVRALVWSQAQEDTEPDLRLSFRQAFFPVDRDHEAHLVLSSCRRGHIKVFITRIPVIGASGSSNSVPSQRPSVTATCKVKDFVTTTLDAFQSESVYSFVYHLSVPCPCTPGAPLHFLSLSDCLVKDRMSCPKVPGRRICTKDIQEKFVPQVRALKDEYVMSDEHLSAIGRKIGLEWEQLAGILGFERHQVEKMKADNPHSVDNAILTMLHKWSKGAKTQDRYERAALLKSALKKCGCGAVADELL